MEYVVELIFWVSLLSLFYIYLGYPFLVYLMGRLLNREVKTDDGQQGLPSVTVLIAAFNEAKHIEATVRNKLNQDYPPHLLDVIVISDESEDGTDEIVQGMGDPRIRLIRQVPRQGKTAGLNLAMPEAHGDIIVFSDANSLYAPDAVRKLVACFADPEVGYVTGRMVYKAPDGSLTGEGCSSYMRYENKLREWETRVGSIVGVDGGIDAIRRALYRPMRADQLPDFVQPLTVREQGYRVVYQEEALLYEDALAAAGDEYRMRVRVGLRAFHALKDKVSLFNPIRFGVFAWQLFSHKLMRYMAFVFQVGAILANLFLVSTKMNFWMWWIFLACQVLFYVLASYGQFKNSKGQDIPKIVGQAYYLCVLNLASAQAFGKFMMGKKQVIWKPRT